MPWEGSKLTLEARKLGPDCQERLAHGSTVKRASLPSRAKARTRIRGMSLMVRRDVANV